MRTRSSAMPLFAATASVSPSMRTSTSCASAVRPSKRTPEKIAALIARRRTRTNPAAASPTATDVRANVPAVIVASGTSASTRMHSTR